MVSRCCLLCLPLFIVPSVLFLLLLLQVPCHIAWVIMDFHRSFSRQQWITSHLLSCCNQSLMLSSCFSLSSSCPGDHNFPCCNESFFVSFLNYTSICSSLVAFSLCSLTSALHRCFSYRSNLFLHSSVAPKLKTINSPISFLSMFYVPIPCFMFPCFMFLCSLFHRHTSW